MPINQLLQTTTETFWDIENAIQKQEAFMAQLLKARQDIVAVVQSLRVLSPETFKNFDMMRGKDDGKEPDPEPVI